MSSQDKLSAARQKLKESGKSPVAIGKESKLLTMDWVYRWGFTSAAVLLDLLGRTSGGYAQRLAGQGLLVQTKNGERAPREYFTLTEEGLRAAEKNAFKQAPYPELNPLLVKHRLIQHDLTAQRETIAAMKDGFVVDYETERFFDSASLKAGVKRPDVVWNLDIYRVGVEIELSPKWDRDLDMFISGLIRAMGTDDNGRSIYDNFVLIFDSKNALERYKSAMKPQAIIRKWSKSKRNHWEVDQEIKVPDWLISKIEFRMVGQK